MSPIGIKYLFSFMDDFSRVTWFYLMKSHYEFFFSYFSAFCAKIQTQFHVFVQTSRSDNAIEYLSKPFQSFYNMKFSIIPFVLILPLRIG